MKTLVVIAALSLAVCSLTAQSAPAAKAPEVKAETKAAPAVKTPAKKAEKKVEAEPVIPGTNVVRSDGTYLGLEVVDGRFKLSFYDKKKKIMAPNVTRAAARWPDPRAPGDDRTVLNPSGNALVGAKPVRPPFTFNVYLTLLEGEGDETKAVETLVIPFRG